MEAETCRQRFLSKTNIDNELSEVPCFSRTRIIVWLRKQWCGQEGVAITDSRLCSTGLVTKFVSFYDYCCSCVGVLSGCWLDG